ncbi:2-oxoisovalerate dehydrogenase subunit alpha, mitochondrial [Condylostylus longicornis]|uniref:2-oxoisovalerate dehydrogenase subunit alpha, mitochondrial n=1 Tax=Condylostylus longicornis TaxID=2530218 RepID=UPI00244E28BC|nr:2-oxoisovalerate dehydrogenase subunit alpha, mitochondrial [Condylostylus longicornis]
MFILKECPKIGLILSRSCRTLSKRTFFVSQMIQQQKSTDLASFPGAKAPFVINSSITLPESIPPVPIFRIINSKGEVEDGAVAPNLDKDFVVKMFESMVLLNTLDKILYESQRQGRISFYMTNFGEEASHVGSAAALESDDLIYGQYREAGILVWRGFTLSQFIDQCYGNVDDDGRGKQMPVHYGSKALNFVTISSPLATQIPQAVGAAYAFKRNKNNKNIVVCYFGEGAASEGDTHAAFNFASTLECPIILFCRNNGFAISTPSFEQYKGDGIAGRASGYGMATIRVDGTDILAVYSAMKEAREYVLKNNKPIIFEALAYRVGHHSTSDDSSSYRSLEEVEIWNTIEHPINKLKNYMAKKNWFDEEMEVNFVKNAKKQIMAQIALSEKKLKPNWKELFEDVYYKKPNILNEQSKQLEEHLRRHKEHYPLKNFK